MIILAQAASTTKLSCEPSQFSIIVKTASESKVKADQNSKTVKTYTKNKKLSVSKRTRELV